MPRAGTTISVFSSCSPVRGRLLFTSVIVALSAAFAGPAVAQSVVKLSSDSAETTVTSGGTSCGPAKYQASLSEIRTQQYGEIKAARDQAGAPDKSLPGRLIFNPISAPKTGEARRALMAANQLARSQNRPGWLSGKDSRWIVGEVSNELGRYLGQDATDYLCGGVPDYLKTMRSYLARAGGDLTSLDALKTAQAEVASQSILATLDALRPVPLPTAAPDRRDAPSAGDLRPAMGLAERASASAGEENAPASGPAANDQPDPAAAIDPAATGGTTAASALTASSAGGDPALPPLTEPEPVILTDDADRLAAVDKLVEAARLSGALPADAQTATEPDAVDAESTDPAGVAAPTASEGAANGRPVLSRLLALRPLVYGGRPAISDVSVRRRLIDSFSAIELLDYLDHRPAENADSVPAAIGRTIDAIAGAHKQDCGCGSN